MKIFAWRSAYWFAGLIHVSGILCIRLAERLDKRLTDTYRKLW